MAVELEKTILDESSGKADNAAISEALASMRGVGPVREQGVRRLYDRFALKFQRYFVRHRVPLSQAEELVQEVFIRVMKGCDDYRGEAPPTVWLWTIVRNTMVSFHRGKATESASTQASDDETERLLTELPAAYMPSWVQDCLGRQMARFEVEHPERAECISAIVLQDWGVDELAQFLGRSLAATREYVSQCRKKLRSFLHECGEVEGGYGL